MIWKTLFRVWVSHRRMFPELEALWGWINENPIVVAIPPSLLALLTLLYLVFRRVRDFLRLLWRGGTQGYNVVKHWLRRGFGKIAYWCRELWRKMQDKRRQRVKRRVIRKLRCFGECGELKPDQVEFLAQAIVAL